MNANAPSPALTPPLPTVVAATASQADWESWISSWYALLGQPLRTGVSPLAPSGARGAADASAHPSPQVLVFAPHPDDECIVGALPLR
ncbi:hypothetical protein FUT87_27175, partial [Mitsuaria sp. TWR114]